MLRSDLSKFEGLLHSGSIFTRPLSKVYALLTEADKPEDTSHKRWEREIGTEITEIHLCQTNKYALEISANTAVRESFVKVRSRGYLVLTRLHKMLPSTEPNCW